MKINRIYFSEALNELEKFANELTSVESYIKEYDNDYKIIMVVPGMDKSNLKISEDNGKLSIEYKAPDNTEPFKTKSFKKRYNIPSDTSSNNIDAEYKDGILTVNLPKNKKNKVNIEVK